MQVECPKCGAEGPQADEPGKAKVAWNTRPMEAAQIKAAICLWCGKAIEHPEAKDDVATIEAVRVLREHDFVCEKNPILGRLHLVEALLRARENELVVLRHNLETLGEDPSIERLWRLALALRDTDPGGQYGAAAAQIMRIINGEGEPR